MFLIIVLLAVCCIGVLSLILKKTDTKEKQQERVEQAQDEDLTLKAKHVCGLPIAENAVCEINYLKDSIRITQAGNVFNLDLNKVTDISTTTDVEIQKHYVSSVGGAVGGAVMFGALGAMIGGRATEKESKIKTHYLVITYKNDDDINYISFEHEPSYMTGKFTYKFKGKDNKAQSIIEL